ncbi:unannotated protein [freshwater metagenome]|jgi:transporter family-2 protein|uniref:Unannotated protein n=1 Tax=freshwater metagenome TaxID=449393 RepID=A0A6J7TQ92_9ZZZZ|nr:hypothetical protein [Actinomycetota bacterium]MTA67442.1 hypothetical protein [Actinomycetota bacterium]MTB16301.1 hypothetical protein [Actinomycetota bacterium]
MRLDFLAAFAGVLIAVQSRVNGELSHRLNNGLEAALFSFSSGLIAIFLISLFIPGMKLGASKIREAVKQRRIPIWRLFAGALGATFVAVQTNAVPILGVAIFSVASIAGQAGASLLIDRIGLTGGGKKAITWRRISAAGLTIIAVLISVWDRIDAHNLSILALVLACLAGVIVGIQRALNGQINEFSQQSFTTSLLNFVTGTAFLLILFIGGLVIHKTHFTPLGNGPWWMYLGGVVGVLYVAFSSTIVQHLGVLTFTLFTVGGQLIGSLIIDLVIPTHGISVSWYLVSGIVLTYIGVIVGGSNQSRRARK